jgi:hypothetical protein
MFFPGAVSTNPNGFVGQAAITMTGGNTVSVNGNRQQANQDLLDGMNINETLNDTPGYNRNARRIFRPTARPSPRTLLSGASRRSTSVPMPTTSSTARTSPTLQAMPARPISVKSLLYALARDSCSFP